MVEYHATHSENGRNINFLELYDGTIYTQNPSKFHGF